MTFSSETKNTVCRMQADTWCCKRSELAALVGFAGTQKNGVLKLNIENRCIADRILMLFRQVTLTDLGSLSAPKKAGGWYTVTVDNPKDTLSLLKTLALDSGTLCPAPDSLTSDCCRTSFVRGAFLGGGSVADPKKNYHLEFVTANSKLADYLTLLLETLGFSSGLTVRKNYFVIYMKESDAIAELLGCIGAGTTMMDFYNIKIERELRNQVNRQVNCDSANIKKTTSAAKKQLAAIYKIDRTIGIDSLPAPLAEIARARIENPELSLTDLAKTLSEPLGKSGVNHRLAKLLALADSIEN